MSATVVSIDERTRLVAGLRELADWLEEHPEIVCNTPYASAHLFSAAPGALVPYARAMGHAEKDGSGDYFKLTKKFQGGVTYWVQTERENVCERVVTTREVTVEEPDPEALAAVPVRTVTKTVEEVEWRCPETLLGGTHSAF